MILNVLTLGGYYIVWFYRNWSFIKKNEQSSIWPWARAIMPLFFYGGLLRRVNVPSADFLAISFFVLSISGRLPWPLWIIVLFSFTPLIPAVRSINLLNGDAAHNHPSFTWRKRSSFVAIIWPCLIGFFIFVLFGPLSTVISGSELRRDQLAYLEEIGALDLGEEVIFFYSEGIFSIQEHGVFCVKRGSNPLLA